MSTNSYTNMSSARQTPSLNPSVEEVNDDSTAERNFTNSAPNRTQLSWSELYSRHEVMLSSHLEMLHQARTIVAPDDANALRMVTSMAQKTTSLVTQFKILKNQLMSGLSASESGSGQASSSSHSEPGRAPFHSLPMSHGRRKRTELDRGELDEGSESTDSLQAPEPARAQKRKRLDLATPGNDEDVRNVTPVSMETEDISEEVQRRLEIKEEQRSKRTNRSSKPEKRKRDSLASNGSVSSSHGTSSTRKRNRAPALENSDGEYRKRGRSKLRGIDDTSGSYTALDGKRKAKRQKRVSSSS